MARKNIVITGATGGVGSMIALGLAAKGNHIICLGRRQEALTTLEKQINEEAKSTGGSASFKVVDMMDTDIVKVVGKEIKQEFGQIDVWINNVGVNNHNAIGPSWELEPQNWWSEVSSNFYTAYIGSVTAINNMKDQNSGYIINLGGGGVERAKSYGSAYGSAKTAIVKFTETLSLELEAEGLHLKTFAFNPGFIRNERTEKLVESEVCRKYMPGLRNTLRHGKMSDINDSVELLDTLISGRIDALGGCYFFADDDDMEKVIENIAIYKQESYNLMHVKKINTKN